MKLLTNYFGIAIERVNHLIASHIEGIDVSLMAAVVELCEVSLDVGDCSTDNLDVCARYIRHGMNFFAEMQRLRRRIGDG